MGAQKASFKVNFTRGYNLFLNGDWLKAMHALTRLSRYLLGGDASSMLYGHICKKEADTTAEGVRLSFLSQWAFVGPSYTYITG